MAKPFRFAELLARVRCGCASPARQGPRDDVLEAGPFRLDLRTRRAGRSGGRPLGREPLAEIFLRNPGQVLREQLLSHVWGYDFDPGSNVVDVYVGYLRRKLGAEAISTVRGLGYRFNP